MAAEFSIIFGRYAPHESNNFWHNRLKLNIEYPKMKKLRLKDRSEKKATRLARFLNYFALFPLVIVSLTGCNEVKPNIQSSPAQKQIKIDDITLTVPQPIVSSKQLGLIVNRKDPQSVAIADYYQHERKIPKENIVYLDFHLTSTLTPKQFARLNKKVQNALSDEVQFLALAWSLPNRVDCMSITSAFTFGYDPAWCATGCKATKPSPYFNHQTRTPWKDLGIRPSMLLAGHDIRSTIGLIDRGVLADASYPEGTTYLLSTSDKDRNSRLPFYQEVQRKMADIIPVSLLQQDSLEGKKDVLFYFTGVANVENINNNTYLPGAIADHLTSVGGRTNIPDLATHKGQTSVLHWVQAGVTGTYGTVLEPCNFPAKFPHPGFVIKRYYSGESLIESYWKSVAWPGQGLFVGEPLATPFGGLKLNRYNSARGAYVLQGSNEIIHAIQCAYDPEGPYFFVPSKAGQLEQSQRPVVVFFVQDLRDKKPNHPIYCRFL